MTLARAFLLATLLALPGCARHPGQGGPAASAVATPREADPMTYWLLAAVAGAILLNADLSLRTGTYVGSGSGSATP